MPKIGTYASLYFPEASENNATILGCIRKNGDSCLKTGNPNMRYFGTEHGSELELTPSSINIIAGSKEPLKISIDDALGITLTSHKKLKLNAAQEISFITPKRITISAQSQLFIKKSRAASGFSIENEHHFKGSNTSLNGEDREIYSNHNDDPQVGTPTPAPAAKEESKKEEKKKGFNWGKLIVCAVAAVVVVGVIAASVITFGGAAVLGAALLGAAMGAAVGIGSTLASDIKNHKRSSSAEYLKNAGKGALIGAIVGAMFGPAMGVVGGASETALLGKTTAQLTAQFGKTLFVGGAASSTYYVLHELYEKRMPSIEGQIESFKNGALFAGVATAVTPWIAGAANKIGSGINNLRNNNNMFLFKNSDGFMVGSKVGKNARIFSGGKGINSEAISELNNRFDTNLKSIKIGKGESPYSFIWGKVNPNQINFNNVGIVPYKGANSSIIPTTPIPRIPSIVPQPKLNYEVPKLPVGGKEFHDYKEWEDCPVSGDYQLTPRGLRIVKVKDIKKIKFYMENNNIKLIIDKKGRILPDNAAGGFNYNTGEIVLRDNPSFLSLKHESYHAEQYIKLGKEKYLEQTVLEREEYVYNQIMKNKEYFNSSEILEAQRYIYKLRNGDWPPSDWKGFTE